MRPLSCRNGVVALALLVLAGWAGVASDPRERLILETPGETVERAQSGRFVIRAVTRGQEGYERGAQGRFEWLRYGQRARHVLIWLGPLGPSAGSLAYANGQVRAFDDQGIRLGHQDQLRFLQALLGQGMVHHVPESEIEVALRQLMLFFEAAEGVAGVQQTVLTFGDLLVTVRIVVD